MTAVAEMLQLLADQLGRDIALELVEVFCENSDRQLSRIAAAIETGDLDAVNREAHSLKSSSANLGAHVLSGLCVELEHSPDIDTAKRNFERTRAARSSAVALMIAWRDAQLRAHA